MIDDSEVSSREKEVLTDYECTCLLVSGRVGASGREAQDLKVVGLKMHR